MKRDTRFGVHGPTDFRWVPSDIPAYIADLESHGVSHYTLWANDYHLVSLARALVNAEIDVIYRPGLMRVPDPLIAEHAKAYYDVGVKRLQLYNEPNLRLEWRQWPGNKAPVVFAQCFAKYHQVAKNVGYTVVVAPLSPGGDFYHRDFFNLMNAEWKRLGILNEIWNQAICGIHNRPTTNHPDDTGPCSYDEYKWFRRRLFELTGKPVRMIAPEWGYQPDEVKFPTGQYDWPRWCAWNLMHLRRFRRADPKYVGDDFLAGCFWLLQDNGGSEEHRSLRHNWYYANEHDGQFETNLWLSLANENWSEYDGQSEPNPDTYTYLKGLKGKGLDIQDWRPWVWKRSDHSRCLVSRRTLHSITGAVIHNSGIHSSKIQDPGVIAEQDINDEGAKTCRYHWIIDRKGTNHFMVRLVDTPDHSGPDRIDRETIGICLIGDFTAEQPTYAQLQALNGLLAGTRELLGGGWGQYRTFWIAPHRYFTATACPGHLLERRLFDLRGVL